ncbi:hypothetical protein KY092_10295 [Natronomonas gomsonensis]|jgi:hypothetical protein|uniref:hypothetical protein n=1 Tax=Natronomonas gomsonensis TaxID=1046043 RepID=UPI0020CA4BDB|nr:hypothetical protein [Natronomonas gomsonensis]MCY4730944.1 hypothetical protein [Natronomonas gomsonensis]
MPECDYCGASHDTEEAHLEHLKSAHADELGPIDKRRVGDIDGDDGLPTGPIALGVVLLASLGIVGYVVFVAGSGSAAGDIGPAGSAHHHGTINVTITGETFDFSQARWKQPQEYPRFHFEGRSDDRWHAHATGMTLEYGMNTLGFEITDNSVTYDGTEYVDGEGYEVVVEVSGEDVSPDYVLQEGDHIRIVVSEA